MSEYQHERFEMPKGMRSMAEAGFEQARKGFEQFLAGAQQAEGSIEERGATVRAGAKDISAKAFAYAEKNVQASLDHAQALLHAKNVAEVDAIECRLCPDPDARSRRTGERNEPDCRPRRDGGRQAEDVKRLKSIQRARCSRRSGGVHPRAASAGVPGTSRLPCGIAPQTALRCTKLT